MKEKFTSANTVPFEHHWIENFLSQEEYNKIKQFAKTSDYESVGDSCRSSISMGDSRNSFCMFPFVLPNDIVETLTDVFWNSIKYQ